MSKKGYKKQERKEKPQETPTHANLPSCRRTHAYQRLGLAYLATPKHNSSRFLHRPNHTGLRPTIKDSNHTSHDASGSRTLADKDLPASPALQQAAKEVQHPTGWNPAPLSFWAA